MCSWYGARNMSWSICCSVACPCAQLSRKGTKRLSLVFSFRFVCTDDGQTNGQTDSYMDKWTDGFGTHKKTDDQSCAVGLLACTSVRVGAATVCVSIVRVNLSDRSKSFVGNGVLRGFCGSFHKFPHC